MLPISLFNPIVPMLIGAILCAVFIYAWENRSSTVFICLYCGALLMSIFFALCQLGMFDLTYYAMILAGGFDDVDLAVVINGAYVAMFWVSFVSFIKARRRKPAS